MAQMRRENVRITGRSVGQDSNRVTSYPDRNLTPEQKAQKAKETEASYQRWLEARRARLQRPRLLRS